LIQWFAATITTGLLLASLSLLTGCVRHCAGRREEPEPEKRATSHRRPGDEREATMTPQNTHKGDWKLLLTIGGFIVAGAAAIAILAGLAAEREAERAAATVASETVSRTVSRPGPAADPEPESTRVETRSGLQEKIAGSTVGPEIAEQIEAEEEDSYPVDPNANFASVGHAAFGARDYEKAVAYWKADVEARPERAFSHYMLGLSLWKQGQLDESTQALQRAAELNPDSIRTLVNLSRVLNARGEFQAGLEAAESARRIDAEDPQALYLQARSLHNLQRDDEAVVALETALAFDSEYGHARNLLGLIQIHRGALDAAVENLNLAARYEPDVAFIHANLGRALELSGLHGEAAESFRVALELDPGQRTAVAGLARVGSSAQPVPPAELPAEQEAVAAVSEPSETVQPDSAENDGTLNP
jgi:tetratricopeptide (TPR) repeat protein